MAAAGRLRPDARFPESVTTRTYSGTAVVDGMNIEFMPVALHCYTIARNLLRGV
jgi:hypothetical protein